MQSPPLSIRGGSLSAHDLPSDDQNNSRTFRGERPRLCKTAVSKNTLLRMRPRRCMVGAFGDDTLSL
jgi:hypothetical protein